MSDTTSGSNDKMDIGRSTGDSPPKPFAGAARSEQRLSDLEFQIDELQEYVETQYEEQEKYNSDIQQYLQLLNAKINNVSEQAQTEVENQVKKELTTSIHVPIVLGLTIGSLLIGTLELISGSLIGLPIIGVGIFAYLNWRKIKKRYDLKTRDVI